MSRKSIEIKTIICDTCGAETDVADESQTPRDRSTFGWLGTKTSTMEVPVVYHVAKIDPVNADWCSLFCYFEFLRVLYANANPYPVNMQPPEVEDAADALDEKYNDNIRTTGGEQDAE